VTEKYAGAVENYKGIDLHGVDFGEILDKLGKRRANFFGALLGGGGKRQNPFSAPHPLPLT
jgi:hypothetical protein